MRTNMALTVGLFSILAFTPQLGNFYARASIEQTLGGLPMQIFQTPPPPCDPVNDPSSCRSS